MQKVHFIAIGGAIMHNLAIALSLKEGFEVSGSDDEIYEPSLSRLRQHCLLPKELGWFPDKIHKNLSFVIVGMHAKEDNPELIRAKELGLRVLSFPEFLYIQTRSKTRIVVGGSHGKSTTTAMILHVMKKLNFKVDYMVGAQIPGFDDLVSLSDDARVAVFEGHDYVSSAIDPKPKLLHYKANIAIITGVAWDHIDVFPTFLSYADQFRQFIESMEIQGRLIYCDGDETLKQIVKTTSRIDIVPFPYKMPKYEVRNGVSYVKTRQGMLALEVFGEHNLQNMEAARMACRQVGIWDDKFYDAIADFPGAALRLEKIEEKPDRVVFRDFAHTPAKLRASINAVKTQYPNRKIIACLELYSFSSLSREFLPQFHSSMDEVDVAYVYFNSNRQRKKQKPLLPDEVMSAFGGNNLKVFSDIESLKRTLSELNYKDSVLLLMSSGNFSGINLAEFADELMK